MGTLAQPAIAIKQAAEAANFNLFLFISSIFVSLVMRRSLPFAGNG